MLVLSSATEASAMEGLNGLWLCGIRYVISGNGYRRVCLDAIHPEQRLRRRSHIKLVSHVCKNSS